MAGVSDAALKEMTQEERVTALGMRTDQLTGRAMQSHLIQTKRNGLNIHGRQRSISTNGRNWTSTR